MQELSQRTAAQEAGFYQAHEFDSATSYQPVSQNADPGDGSQPVAGGRIPGVKPLINTGTQSKTQLQRKRFTHLTFPGELKWWWPELLAILVSVVALVAIVFIAQHYRGHSIQDVAFPTGLSFNGLIALLSTISRAALLIPIASTLSQEAWLWLYNFHKNRAQLGDLETSDDASRGAWGSFLLLMQFRRSWLAQLAAIISVFSLIFGTFTQQLITINTFAVDNTLLNPGNIPWISHWKNYTGDYAGALLSPPLSLKAAAYNGACSNSSTTPSTNCPTGNCTWPVTPSIAICGGCQSTDYARNCSNNTCWYTTASGRSTNLTDFDAQDPSVLGGIVSQIIPGGGHRYPFDNSTMYLTHFEVVGAAPTGSRRYEKAGKSILASECALWMCVQSFESRVVNAHQTTVLRDEFSKAKGYQDRDPDPDYLFGNVSFDIAKVPQDMNLAPAVNYTVYVPALTALQRHFAGMFEGTVKLHRSKISNIVECETDIIQALWYSTLNLDSWVRNIAAAATSTIRTYDPISPPLALYNGAAFQLGYDIRWEWITVPVILVASSLFVLIVVMVKTANNDIRPWKGSPLVALLMSIDGTMKKTGSGALDERKGVLNTLGTRRVGLDRDCEGEWKIKSA